MDCPAVRASKVAASVVLLLLLPLAAAAAADVIPNIGRINKMAIVAVPCAAGGAGRKRSQWTTVGGRMRAGDYNDDGAHDDHDGCDYDDDDGDGDPYCAS